MNPASNLLLVGPMGAGKSSIGKRLASRFGLVFIDVDDAIVERTGATIPMIFECEGEAGFRERERATLAALLESDDQLLATGGGAVLDAGNRQLLRERGFVVYLHVGIDQQLARLARDRTRPLLANADREQVLRGMATLRLPLYEEVADLRFDTNVHSANNAADALARLLDAHWTRPAAFQAEALLQDPT
ncbi:shikimate kinase [Luteimonas sp. RIT-PG2_3]